MALDFFIYVKFNQAILDITTEIVYTKIKQWIINRNVDVMEVRAYDGAMISSNIVMFAYGRNPPPEEAIAVNPKLSRVYKCK